MLTGDPIPYVDGPIPYVDGPCYTLAMLYPAFVDGVWVYPASWTSVMIEAHRAGIASRRSARAAKTAANRPHRKPYQFPWQHTLETAAEFLRVPRPFLRRVIAMGSSCPPRALLEALRLVTAAASSAPRPGRQRIEGVVASRKVVVMPWGGRERDVWTVDTPSGMNLYGTVPPWLSGKEVGDRVEFVCDVQPGCYKYWRPKPCSLA